MHKPQVLANLELELRRRRFAYLVAVLSTTSRPLSILDVGGTPQYWQQMNYMSLGDVEIVLLNVFPQPDLPFGMSAIVGDARDLGRYSDQEFDLVHSNSVIGHVGNLADQTRMAQEMRRVGKGYFLQTPNQRFLVDWRTMVPFFHFLPVSLQAWCFRHFRVGTYPRVRDNVHSLELASRIQNLTRKELAELFPGASIVPERHWGFTKSFLVHDLDGLMRTRC